LDFWDRRTFSLMSIIIFLAALALLILSHEFGHFIVAKKSGMRVDEFGLGFPPRLLKFKKGETVYSLNLIPLGGFVKIHGEDGAKKGDPRSFSSKPVSIRSAVIAAGVMFNLLAAWFLLSGGFLVGMPADANSVPAGAAISKAEIMIIQVQRGTPAQEAGLKAGDKLVDFSSVEDVQKFIAENKGKKIEIRYERNGKIASVSLVPDISPAAGKGSLGIAMDKVVLVNLPFFKALWEGAKMTYNLTIAVAVSIFYFIIDAFRGMAGFGQILGPVGIAGVTGSAAKLGFGYLLSFVAMLSVNLAIINMIPFPGLDGGRLVFLAVEKIKGSPINPKFSNIANGIGLLLLFLLMLAITYKDIMRLV